MTHFHSPHSSDMKKKAAPISPKTMSTPSDEINREKQLGELKRFRHQERFAKARFEQKLYRSS